MKSKCIKTLLKPLCYPGFSLVFFCIMSTIIIYKRCEEFLFYKFLLFQSRLRVKFLFVCAMCLVWIILKGSVINTQCMFKRKLCLCCFQFFKKKKNLKHLMPSYKALKIGTTLKIILLSILRKI